MLNKRLDKMKKIVLTYKEGKFFGDCKRIQEIFSKRGYDITMEQASFLWEKYSAEMSSGWLCLLSSDDQIFESVQEFWDEV